MNIDRPALKGRAKGLVTGSKPSPIWVGLVYLLPTSSNCCPPLMPCSC